MRANKESVMLDGQKRCAMTDEVFDAYKVMLCVCVVRHTFEMLLSTGTRVGGGKGRGRAIVRLRNRF